MSSGGKNHTYKNTVRRTTHGPSFSEGQIHVLQSQSLSSFVREIQSNPNTAYSLPWLKRNLGTYLGEVSADSLAVGHCRLHRQVLQVLVAHHNRTDDTLGRWAGSAQMVEQVELIGWHSLWVHPQFDLTYGGRKRMKPVKTLCKERATIQRRKEEEWSVEL